MKYLISIVLLLIACVSEAEDFFIPRDLVAVEVYASDRARFRVYSTDFKIILCDNTTPLDAYAGGGNGQIFLQDLFTGETITIRYDSRSYNEDAESGGADVLKLFIAEDSVEDAVGVFTSNFENCQEYIAGIPPPP